MFVLGTAGHVDHGKSALVKSLTGIDPDRLPEEKARGLTIDLGFAWYTMADGTSVGIVDVPGHERFVKNMIAGVGAIDFVIFVIAADDGWMPQSAEHLDILRFLGVQHGIIAITKTDLVDQDWLELVIADVQEKTSGTFLEGAPVVRFSAITGDGLDDLKTAIDTMVTDLPQREDIGRPRLYIDRAFTIAGRGSVVTGTLSEGPLKIGQEISVVPSGLKGRVRELQSHKQKVESVGPGRRVAVNISGIERSDLSRGECLVETSDAQTYSFVLVQLTLLEESHWSIKTGRSLLALLGTAEPEAVCRLLDSDEIKPGESGICELRLETPVKARLGDRFVLRLPTPGVTIGGGRVLDFPTHRVTRSDVDYLTLLNKRREDFTLSTVLGTEIIKLGWLPKSAKLPDLPFSDKAIKTQIAAFIDSGKWTKLPDGYLDTTQAETYRERALALLAKRHTDLPFEYGYNEAEWRGKLKISESLFKTLLNSWLRDKIVSVRGGRYQLPDFEPGVPQEWQAEADVLEKMIAHGKMLPPVRSELESKSKNAPKIINLWLSMNKLVGLPEGIVYPQETFGQIVEKIKAHCKAHETITVAQVRDMLGTTRKYTVPILTHTDDLGLTRREGDFRRWIGED